MKIKNAIVAVPLLLGLAAAYAAEPLNGQQQIIQEIKQLQQAGLDLHARYDLDDIAQLRACAKESHPLRAQAKPLAEQVKALPTAAVRYDLLPAAYAVFSCVYCSDTLNDCAAVSKYLKALAAK